PGGQTAHLAPPAEAIHTEVGSPGGRRIEPARVHAALEGRVGERHDRCVRSVVHLLPPPATVFRTEDATRGNRDEDRVRPKRVNGKRRDLLAREPGADRAPGAAIIV